MAATVQDLLTEVRSQTDESNTIDVTDDKIVAALNRAQRKAANIVSRQYDELFWDSEIISAVGGQRDYAIPARAYGRRIEKIEVITEGNLGWEVTKISNSDRTAYFSNTQTARPVYYSQRKNLVQFYPIPNGTFDLEIHYTRAPEKLVKPQGRVETVNTGGQYVILDAVGSDLTTTVESFGAYVNFVDFVTGAVKGTSQILSIDATTRRVNFKTSALTRTTVLGRTVGVAIPTTVVADDYVCVVVGTCVPELPDAYVDYLTQYAVLEIKRSHGEPTAEEYAQLKELAEELEKAWAGRELSHRVKKTSDHWTNRVRMKHNRLLV